MPVKGEQWMLHFAEWNMKFDTNIKKQWLSICYCFLSSQIDSLNLAPAVWDHLFSFPFVFFFSFLFWLLLQHNGTKCHQHSGCTTCCPGCYTLRRDKVTKNWHQISTSSFVLFLEDYARTHRSWVTSGICSLCLKRQMKQQKTS